MHTREWLTATILAVLLAACDGRNAASAGATGAGEASVRNADETGSSSAVAAQDPDVAGETQEAGEIQGPVAARSPRDIYGFDTWVDGLPDAPGSPHISPRRAGMVYDRTRSQAIESVARHLQGNCSRDAWLFAKDFFSRVHEPEDLDILIRILDEALQTPHMSDLAENCLEALGRSQQAYCAPALLRGLEHAKMSVRIKAMQSLVQAGDAASVREAWRYFSVVDGKGMEGWLQAAVRHLPGDELARTLRGLLADPRMEPLHRMVVEHAIQVDPAVAVQVFSDFVGREPAGLRGLLAVLRHRSGDAGGSAMLLDMLRDEAPQVRHQAISALATGGAEDFLDELLAATTDPDPDVRLAVIAALSTIQGESVDLALDGLTLDEFVDVRRAALGVLVQRGFSAPLEDLVETVRRATGTRLQAAMEDLVGSRYPGAVPVLAERMRGLNGEDRERMLRAIGLTTTAEAFVVLRDEFVRDEPGAEEHLEIIALTMANCRGAEFAMLELLDELPADDYVRRARLMKTLGNVAADRTDPEIKAAIYARLREVVADQEAAPQMRLLALEYARRGLGPEHVSWLKTVSRAGGRPMRDALSDQLFEFF